MMVLGTVIFFSFMHIEYGKESYKRNVRPRGSCTQAYSQT